MWNIYLGREGGGGSYLRGPGPLLPLPRPGPDLVHTKIPSHLQQGRSILPHSRRAALDTSHAVVKKIKTHHSSALSGRSNRTSRLNPHYAGLCRSTVANHGLPKPISQWARYHVGIVRGKECVLSVFCAVAPLSLNAAKENGRKYFGRKWDRNECHFFFFPLRSKLQRMQSEKPVSTRSRNSSGSKGTHRCKFPTSANYTMR